MVVILNPGRVSCGAPNVLRLVRWCREPQNGSTSLPHPSSQLLFVGAGVPLARRHEEPGLGIRFATTSSSPVVCCSQQHLRTTQIPRYCLSAPHTRQYVVRSAAVFVCEHPLHW